MHHIRYILSLLVLVLSLTACGAAPMAVADNPPPTARPTHTPEPTARPTKTPHPTNTPAPSATPMPTALPLTATPLPSPTPDLTLAVLSRPTMLYQHHENNSGDAIGMLCQSATLQGVSKQRIGMDLWVEVLILNKGDCDTPLGAGSRGWIEGTSLDPIRQLNIQEWTAMPAPAAATPPPAPATRPVQPAAPSGVRTGAICRDGSQSRATGRGACSHHGGVARWITN